MDKDAIAIEMQEAGSARKVHDQKLEEINHILANEIQKAEHARKHTTDEFDKAERERLRVLKKAIFNWLDSIAVEDIKGDIFDRHHDGTGMWLFGQTEFNAWSKGAPSLLWVTGKPGSGVYRLPLYM